MQCTFCCGGTGSTQGRRWFLFNSLLCFEYWQFRFLLGLGTPSSTMNYRQKNRLDHGWLGYICTALGLFALCHLFKLFGMLCVGVVCAQVGRRCGSRRLHQSQQGGFCRQNWRNSWGISDSQHLGLVFQLDTVEKCGWFVMVGRSVLILSMFEGTNGWVNCSTQTTLRQYLCTAAFCPRLSPFKEHRGKT